MSHSIDGKETVRVRVMRPPGRDRDAEWRIVLSRSVIGVSGGMLGLFLLNPGLEVPIRVQLTGSAMRSELIVPNLAAVPNIDVGVPEESRTEIEAPDPPEVPSPEQLAVAVPTPTGERIPDEVGSATFAELWRNRPPEAPMPSLPEKVPEPEGPEWASYIPFVPSMVRPELRNRWEVERFLHREYQPLFSASGLQGVVQLRFWIDEVGEVKRVVIARSSGFDVLDELALRLSEIARFRPAVRWGRPVRVEVILPVRFTEGRVS